MWRAQRSGVGVTAGVFDEAGEEAECGVELGAEVLMGCGADEVAAVGEFEEGDALVE